MPYQDLIDDVGGGYDARVSGSHVGIYIYEEGVVKPAIIGGATGINNGDDLEVIPIEEAGNDGVDEIVQGRHSGNCSIQAFWSAKRNDELPTRQTFIGKKYLILETMAVDRVGAGEILNAYVGCVLSGNRGAHGARGPKTIDLTFAYETRYNGLEWATLNGLL